MSILSAGIQWLDEVRRSKMSEVVTVERSWESISIPATLGSTTYEIADDAGFLTKAKSTDFIISASDYVFLGVQTEPQLGDKISVIRGLKKLVFEVLDLGGAHHFRLSDPLGQMLRIHTKQVDEVDV